MEIYEKIKYLMDEQDISKKEFVNKLLSLEPRLKKTGEIPSMQTIYRYLNNSREIKIELIGLINSKVSFGEIILKFYRKYYKIFILKCKYFIYLSIIAL